MNIKKLKKFNIEAELFNIIKFHNKVHTNKK